MYALKSLPEDDKRYATNRWFSSSFTQSLQILGYVTLSPATCFDDFPEDFPPDLSFRGGMPKLCWGPKI